MTHTGFYNTNLPRHLPVLQYAIERYARSYGLDFYETIFGVVDADDLNEIAAYGGFPTRYPHWSFGMQYEELKKGYEYGLSKIYEMVINNDPCYAYLMRCNHTVDQKLVMAHVYGHCLAPETEVETESGIKRITDVKVGDLVLTHTVQYKRVKVVARRHFKGPIYRVRTEGGDTTVRITGEHPVATRHEGKLKWLPASELRAGTFVGLPNVRPESDPVPFIVGPPIAPKEEIALAPRMIGHIEILSIEELQAKIAEALQENPFLELKEQHSEDADSSNLEFNRHDELNREWDDHFNEEHRGNRAAMEEEGDRKLEAMANMPDRPPSLQDYLADQIGELDLEEGERRLARHICSFVDRTGYL